MPTILKMLFVTTLALSLPNLAVAADAAPAVATKPAVPPETPQKAPAVSTVENKPSDTAAHQMTKIGSVDLPRIGTETVQGKAIETKLKGMKDKLQGRVDAKRKQLDKLRASLEAKLPTFTPAQREAKAKEFQKKVEEFQKFGKQLEEELYTTQEKETKGIYDATEQAAVAYGKANGFAVVVIKKELLYVGNNIDAQDITDELIKTMDEAARKK